MSMSQIAGVVLLAVGAVLIFFGWESSQSVVDQVAETFTGRFTEETMWYLVLGAAAAILGLVLLVSGKSRRR